MQGYEDHPTLVDSLARLDHVDRLAAAIATCIPPKVFGVHGDWGAGKTSFLHQLHMVLDGIPRQRDWVEAQTSSVSALVGQALKANISSVQYRVPKTKYVDRNEIHVVWFEAWRYQNESSPVVALLHEIRGQLALLPRILNRGKKIAEIAVRTSLMQIDSIARAASLQSVSPVAIQEAGERWERGHLAETLPADAVRQHLEHAINQLLGKRKGRHPRLVVLIDDLDRCQPEATYRLLEGIKLYLSIPNCVFVLGMDQRIIEEAIAGTAPGMTADPVVAASRAREYLEKLFQEIYYLPIVRDVPSQILSWLPDSAAISPEIRARLHSIFQTYPGCIPANPRKAKAYSTVLYRFLAHTRVFSVPEEPLFESLDNASEDPVVSHPREALIVVLSYLYHFHPELYRLVEAHREAFYGTLLQWCGGTEASRRVHPCFDRLERAYMATAPGDDSGGAPAELRSRHPDYSRGEVLRIQHLIHRAGPFSAEAIESCLL